MEMIREVIGLESKDDVINKCATELQSRRAINILDVLGFEEHPHFLNLSDSRLLTGRASSKRESHKRLCRYLGFPAPTDDDYPRGNFDEEAAMADPDRLEQMIDELMALRSANRDGSRSPANGGFTGTGARSPANGGFTGIGARSPANEDG